VPAHPLGSEQAMKVLFYLPVVTPWWFDNIIVHLIRSMAVEAEVHVIVTPLWRNTGIGPAQLGNCDDLRHVRWHVYDEDDHPHIRFSAAKAPALIELIHEIDADITLCRSADVKNPLEFPGVVRFIMEGAALPLLTAGDWVTIQPMIFDNGAMPKLDPAQRTRLDAMFAPAWAALDAHQTVRSDEWRSALGLPSNGKIIALPLEYEHPENFYVGYRRLKSNAELVADVAQRMPGDWTLALTNHPLNLIHCDNRALFAAIDRFGDRVRMLPDQGLSGRATLALAANADGVIVENSKTFSAAAFFGTPIQRTSRFPTAGWMNNYEDLDRFFAAIASGTAKAAGRSDVRSWLGYHVANNIVDPDHPDHDAADLIARVQRPSDPARWRAGIDRFLGIEGEAVAC
jgi:hypothetical protein